MLKTTGFSGYDAKILQAMRTSRHYSPYLVNGSPANVCTAFTFIYSQTAAPPLPPRP